MNDNHNPAAFPAARDAAPVAACLPDSEGYLGRRVEADGSWTTYHVFTGVPARMNNRLMTGLTRSEATAAMIRRNAGNLNT